MSAKVLPFFLLVAISASCPLDSMAGGSIFGNSGLTIVSYSDSLDNSEVDLYSGFRFALRSESGIRFYLNSRLKAQSGLRKHTDLRVYSCFLEWHGQSSLFTAGAGRMQLFEGVGACTIDGINLKIDTGGESTNVFAGARTPDDLSVEFPDDNTGYAFGASQRLRFFGDFDLLFSSIFTAGIEESDVYDRIGVIADWNPMEILLLQGSAEYDLDNKRLNKYDARVESAAYDTRLYCEYILRETPFIPASSYYSYFRDFLEPTSQIRAGIYSNPSWINWLNVGFDWFSEVNEGNSLNMYAGVLNRLLLGYRLDIDNDDSERSGVWCSLLYPVCREIQVSGGIDMANYRISGSSDNPAFGSFFRFKYNSAGPLYFSGECQYVKNKVYDRDLRLLFGAGFRFSELYGHGNDFGGEW